MNEAKLARMESGLNSMATKVYEAVPIQEVWTKHQIIAELRRRGCGAEQNVVDGCLDTLRGMGLVSEPERGQFTRKSAKPKINQPDIKIVHSTVAAKAVATTTPPQKSTEEDAMSQIAVLSKSLRQIADDFDSVAIGVAEKIQAIEKETQKLRQLQDILKSLGQ